MLINSLVFHNIYKHSCTAFTFWELEKIDNTPFTKAVTIADCWDQEALVSVFWADWACTINGGQDQWMKREAGKKKKGKPLDPVTVVSVISPIQCVFSTH